MFFILTAIFLNILFILVKKNKKQENLLLWITISILVFMSYISLICYIFTYVKIPITTLTISTTNIIFSLFLLLRIIKDRNIQKYVINKLDIILILSLICICIFTFINLYSTNFFVKSETPDGAAHFLSARTFAVNNTLKMNPISKNQSNFDFFQFFGMVNLGMIFKSFPNLNAIEQYKIYSIYNIILYFISGLSFYLVLIQKHNSNILSIIITLLYILGYPLISLNYGFFYWGLSGTIISIIIVLCNMYISDKYNKKLIMLMLSLLNFSLFTCYYMFVPIIYLSIFIFIITYYKKYKKESMKSLIKFIFFVLFMPFLLGYTYFILGSFNNLSDIYIASSSQGSNYKNLINNFILIIPFALNGYIIIRNEKEINFNVIFFIIFIIFYFILFLMMYFDFISSYYFYKIYYILWILIWFFTYISFKENSNKIYNIVIVFIYVFGIIDITTNFTSKLSNKIDDLGDTNSIAKLFDVYDNNSYTLLNDTNIILTSNQVDGLKYVIKNKNSISNKNNEVAVIGTYWQKRWFESITDIIPKIDYNGNILEYYDAFTFDDWEKSNEKTLVILNKLIVNYDYFEYKILYKNNDIIILEKK